MSAPTATARLGRPGPAQSDALIYFTGRPAGLRMNPHLPDNIREMTPDQRLDQMIRTRRIQAFPPIRC